jgi:hypothetical protein
MLRLIFVFLAFVPVVSASCQPNVNATVKIFTFSGGSRVDAVLELGKQTNVCFGLRNLPRSVFVEPVSFRFENQTTKLMIDKIFDGERVDIKQMPDGLVYISRPSKVSSLFDYAMPEFSIERATLQTVSLGLKNRLVLQLVPNTRGIAGNYYSGDQADLVGPFQEYQKTITELLNLIVSASKGATWIATFPDSAAVLPRTENLWTVIEYNRSMRDYRSLMEQIAQNFSASEEEK